MINDFSGKYRFLSNFWSVKILYNGMSFQTVEHAYQAFKCANQEDMIKYTSLGLTAGDAKKLSRTLPIRKDWDDIKVGIMEELLILKFNNPELRKLLLSTKSETLIEGNTWHDNFWGYCTCYSCRGKEHRNMLGLLLMSIRKKLSCN